MVFIITFTDKQSEVIKSAGTGTIHHEPLSFKAVWFSTVGLYGPFDNKESAQEWASANLLKENYKIVMDTEV